MKAATEYTKAARRLNELDVQLSEALDTLTAAHKAGIPDKVTSARLAAEKLEKETEIALYESHRLHTAYWRERCGEIRREAEEALAIARRYRMTLKPADLPEVLVYGLLNDVLSKKDGAIPDDLGAIPYEPQRSRSLDRAEKQIW